MGGESALTLGPALAGLRGMRAHALFAVAVATLAGCSSSGASSPGGGTTISADETWADGKALEGTITIGAGATVTIAPGATIHAANGAKVIVQGTLKSPGGAPAKITAPKTWGGLAVAAGGNLALLGVDLENADTAVRVQAQAASAHYDQGVINNATLPFQVDAGGKLISDHATVKVSGGTSIVEGDFVATHLDYDANGHDGIQTISDQATLSVEDSTLHGTGGDSDMIASYDGAASIHVAYTTIQHVHCAFHLERVTALDVSFVTAQNDSYGFMMHGSLPNGTKTVKSMNMINESSWGIHEDVMSENGPISVQGCYFASNAGDVSLRPGSPIQVTDNVTTQIANAGPRN